MIINLNKYAAEVAAYIKHAEKFVARPFHSRLRMTLEDLENGLDRRRPFKWRTAEAIRTIDTTRYDRRQGDNEPIFATIGFHASFVAPANHKSNDWTVEEMVTHLLIFRAGAEEEPVMHFHVDKKNADQLGPELHMQVSERFTERLGMKLAVPRIPSGFLLPTDCLDFILSELFSADWPREQSGAHALTTLRLAQLERARGFVAAVDAAWRKSLRQTPISVLQDCKFEPAIRLA
ncbi:hypothetical protein [Mesorhizobium sp. M1163]|uniref:hypothetical protein n=1 Tax=Mesorhizobium sp. M1163 TaxID=2957065 RepID=UPI00333D5E2D